MKIGDSLPNFSHENSISNQIDFHSLLGKKTVIYFYPKDNTPGCTVQACNLRDHFEELTNNNIQVIGVSADTLSSHEKFISKHNLPFTLIADEDRLIINYFNVWGPKKFMGKTYDGIHRKSFLFNENGELIDIIDKPKTKFHAEEILMKFKTNT